MWAAGIVTVGETGAMLEFGGAGALARDDVDEVLLLFFEPKEGHQLGVRLVIEQPLTLKSRANTAAARTSENRIRASLSVGSGEIRSAPSANARRVSRQDYGVGWVSRSGLRQLALACGIKRACIRYSDCEPVEPHPIQRFLLTHTTRTRQTRVVFPVLPNRLEAARRRL